MWGYWLFIAYEALFMHLSLPTDALAMSESDYVFIICVNTLILIAVLMKRYSNDQKFVVFIIGGLFLRLFFMFWSEYCSHIFTLPNSGADELTYYYNAMSNMVKDKEFTGYAQFFAWQANIYGLSKIYGKFINVLLSVSSITILRRILIKLDIDYDVQTITIALACFLPNFAIISSLLLRESSIIFLISVSAYYFIAWWQKHGCRNLLFSLVASVIAAWLHSGMVAYTIGILCVAVASKKTMNDHKYSIMSIRTLIVTVMTAVAILAVLMNLDIGLTNYFKGAESLSDIVSISDAYEDGGSAYNANVVSNDTTIGFIVNTPFRILYFMFAPMPWDWRSATDMIAFLFSGLFYGYVFLKSIPYVFKKNRYPLVSAMFMIALLLLMMFGWGVSNSGTALRHRDKMVIHYLILFALIKNDNVVRSKRLTRR
ncbi:MAG: hypothetical protein J6C37_04975 [Roseburia sp.]|nr:hypothetical protein [Roseburia sp.]